MAPRLTLTVCCIIASRFQDVLTDKPEFPKFPDDFSATGTFSILGKNLCFKLWFSKYLRSSRSEFKNHGRVDTIYKLEKMGSFGSQINLVTNFGKTICTLTKGTGWKPVKFEPFFSKFVENAEYRGEVNVNGVDMQKWITKNNHETSTLLVLEYVSGPTPYSIFSDENNGTMFFDTFCRLSPPENKFQYCTNGCRNAPRFSKRPLSSYIVKDSLSHTVVNTCSKIPVNTKIKCIQ